MGPREPGQAGGPVSPDLADLADLTDLEQAARFWDQQVDRPDAEGRHWLECPLARSRVNFLITGNPHTFPLSAFGEDLRHFLPVPRALSIGCGTGGLEREVVRANIATHVDGVDVSRVALERATELSRVDTLTAERITYHLADAASWLAAAEPGRYQLIFFHGSLHHIEALETVISACAKMLRAGPPGLLFVDEYVGPSRNQWCETDLMPARELFARLEPEHRRTAELWQPMDPCDPGEMVRSAEIEPILRAHFEILRYRPYYGNLIYPLLSAIKGSSFSHPDVEQVIRDAIAREDAAIDAGSLRPLFAFFTGHPRNPEDARARAESWRRAHPAGTPPPQTPGDWYEVAFDLRRLVSERRAEQRALYAEIQRLDSHIRAVESTRAWRLHSWLERHVRAPWRAARAAGKPASSRRRGA